MQPDSDTPYVQPIPEDAKLVFRGVLFDVYQWRQAMYDGTTKTFEKLTRHDTGTVIAVTPEGKIIMTREQQPGSRVRYGLPGGRIERGEDPKAGVERELLEETGYTADDWLLWQTIQPHEKINYLSYTYVARHARATREPAPDEGEKIELLLLDFDEFVELVSHHDYRDWEVALGVLKAQHHKPQFAKLRSLILG
jgi:ADP-ribose pyrophosphatase